MVEERDFIDCMTCKNCEPYFRTNETDVHEMYGCCRCSLRGIINKREAVYCSDYASRM
jgi:hypothetical protein